MFVMMNPTRGNSSPGVVEQEQQVMSQHGAQPASEGTRAARSARPEAACSNASTQVGVVCRGLAGVSVVAVMSLCTAVTVDGDGSAGSLVRWAASCVQQSPCSYQSRPAARSRRVARTTASSRRWCWPALARW